MYFLVNNIHKIIFGWSAKCGCSHIKKIYKYISNDNSRELHKFEYYHSPFPESLEGYVVFIILRNPYERLVSGYLDKYSSGGHYYHWWKSELPLTFRNFVDEVAKNDFKMIHRHHFIPQLNDDWKHFTQKISNEKQPKDIVVCDIANINYKYIESICNLKIPKEILEFRGEHINARKEPIDYPVYDMVQSEFNNKKPNIQCFYDMDIASKVYEYYQCDFEYAKNSGIYYVLSNN
jgi:hypothetical protein